MTEFQIPADFRKQLDARLAGPVMLDPRAVDQVRAASSFVARRDMSNTVERVGDVAMVNIHGPLAQRAWSCFEIFSGDGYDAIESRVCAALEDKEVRAVLMNFDSPGGEVAGCFEAVRGIREAATAAGKPMVAFVNEQCTSAAYALACAADAIVLPDTGLVGSIGVIATVTDESEALAKEGIRVHVLSSGARKADGHPAIPLSDEARASLQGQIDYLAGTFMGVVASYRPVLTETLHQYQAGVFYGHAAVSAGLADQVGNLSDALRRATTMNITRATISRPLLQASMEAPKLRRYQDYTATELHKLYHTDRAAYERLKAEPNEDISPTAKWADLTNLQLDRLARTDRARFDRLLEEHRSAP